MISTTAIPARPASSRQQVQDLGLHGDVEGGRRFVGDQQLAAAGQCHRDHHPLPHAAGELVRVLATRRSGGGMPTARAARPRVFAGVPWKICSCQRPSRRSARRPCRPGSGWSSDPGRSSRCPCRAPTAARVRAASAGPCPRRRIRRRCLTAGGLGAAIDSAVAVLPLPDSPTTASVRPLSSEKPTPSTALTTPSAELKRTRRSWTSSSFTGPLLPGSALTIRDPGSSAA